MAEILFRCGDNKRAVVATLDVLNQDGEGPNDGPPDEVRFDDFLSLCDCYSCKRKNVYLSLFY